MLTLHEAIIKVLDTMPNKAATTSDISVVIKNEKLYRKPSDGQYPNASQISARINQYSNKFKRLGDGKITLRSTGFTYQDHFSILKPNVHLDVLRDTAFLHSIHPEEIIYLQPYSTEKWVSVFKAFEANDNPIRILFTPTTETNKVLYCGWLVGIKDKTSLMDEEIREIEKHLPSENESGVYGLSQTPPMRNLLLIKEMKPLHTPIMVSSFKKYKGGNLGKGKRLRYSYARIAPVDESWLDHQVMDVKDADDTYFALEGKRYKSEASFLSRSGTIVREAKARYPKICEACGEKMVDKYGELGVGFIEFHHRVPLGRNPHPTLNSWEDLAPLCPNCHTMIHRTEPLMSVEEFRKFVSGE